MPLSILLLTLKTTGVPDDECVSLYMTKAL